MHHTMGDAMSRPRADHYADDPELGRKVRALRTLNEEEYDLICDIAALEGGAAEVECTAERAAIWKYVQALPRFSKAARAKVWAEA
jgi:hypothetical protein